MAEENWNKVPCMVSQTYMTQEDKPQVTILKKKMPIQWRAETFMKQVPNNSCLETVPFVSCVAGRIVIMFYSAHLIFFKNE